MASRLARRLFHATPYLRSEDPIMNHIMLASSTDDVVGGSSTRIVEGSKGERSRTITKITERWRRMSRRARFILGVYVGGAITNIALHTYEDGKKTLVKHRRNPKPCYELQFDSDWDAVRHGCSKNVWKNTGNGIIWPSEIWSSIMPRAVLALNPAPPVAPPTPGH